MKYTYYFHIETILYKKTIYINFKSALILGFYSLLYQVFIIHEIRIIYL